MNQRTRAATESLTFLIILAGIFVALNVIGVFFFGRIDVTGQRLFSLSEGSKRVVSSLSDNLEITAYFTKDLPPPFNSTERYVRDLLDEYEAASNGRLTVRFINPDSEEAQAQAQADGVKRVAHQKVDNDAVSLVEGYRGLVFKFLGERKTIPAVNDTEGLEYDITQALRELIGQKVKIALISGHNGPSAAAGLSTLQKLLPIYQFLDVSAATPIDQSYKAALVLSPQNELSDEELRNLDAFVMGGGSLGVFGGGLKVQPNNTTGELEGSPINSQLNRLLAKWGVKIEDGMVADAQSRQVPMRTDFGIALPVAYPPWPIMSLDDKAMEHPVAFRLAQASSAFTSPLSLTDAAKDPEIEVTPLASSTRNSWKITGSPINLKARPEREWRSTLSDDRGPYLLAAAIEGRLPSAFAAEAISSTDGQPPPGPKGAERAAEPVHVFVTGSNAMLNDDFLPSLERSSPQEVAASVALALNAIDWLAQEDALIAVRAKNVEEPRLEVPASVRAAESELTQAAEQGDREGAAAALQKQKVAIDDWNAKKAGLRWMNIALMPALFVAFGLTRWQVRKKKRAALTL